MPIQLQPPGNDLEQWVSLSRGAGAAFEVMDPFFLTGLGQFEKYRSLARQFRQSGLVRSVHGAFIDVNPASGDPGFRELSRQRCQESCEIALELGAENVVFHSSCFPFLRGGYLENWADRCADFYRELANRYSLRIFIENAQDLDPTPLRCLMERMDTANVGVCLDIGHAHYSPAPLSDWFTQLGPWIGYLHLSDNLGQFDDHLPLGKGTIPWQQVHALWASLGRDLPITLETGNLESTQESIAFLRSHHYFGLKGTEHETL